MTQINSTINSVDTLSRGGCCCSLAQASLPLGKFSNVPSNGELKGYLMKTSNQTNPPSLQPIQEKVISYLKGLLINPADHITTHCAHIFLMGDIAYKIKSAIKYSYMDLSTLDKRKRLCEREYELNAPVLPDIYLGVVPISLDANQQLTIDGPGVIVEWALKMRRFPEENVLDNIAKRGSLSVSVAKDMGRSLAKYHRNLPSLDVTDGYPRIKEVYEELLNELTVLTKVFASEELEHYRVRGSKALAQSHHHLNQRAIDGFIKRCHGDLHLRNILMTSAGPTPFDALEFDERMATTDVLYDIAFLLMDLLHRDMPEQTNALLNAYLLHSSPKMYEGLRHLPLFLYARAAIRAMTTAQAGSQQTQGAQILYDQARHYLTEANSYLHDSAPRLIAIGGFSGTGKSSVANAMSTRISRAPGAILLRSDSERKMLAGVNETERLPESHYTKENSLMVYKHLFSKAQMALESGSTVIIDAVFHEEELRVQAQEIAHRTDVPFTGLWLEAPTPVLKARINQRHNDASDADVQVLQKQLLKATGFLKWRHVDASGSLAQTINIATKELRSD